MPGKKRPTDQDAAAARRALLDALLALVREGHARPTVADVAARARVSVRIVYYHFGGIRELLVAAVSLQAERCRHLLFGVTPNGPLELRISALCRQRRLYFEEMMPVFGTALARAHGRNGFRALLVDERTLLRDQLARTLAPELRSLGERAPETLAAVEHVTGWDAWCALRQVSGYSAASSERVVAITVAGLLT